MTPAARSVNLISMKLEIRFAFVMALLLAAGCRQPDGPVPTPTAEGEREIGDIARDLNSIASGRDPQAPKDLADDLRRYVEDKRPAAVPAVDELARRTAALLPTKNLATQTSQQLARNLWLSIMARELSDRQVEKLQNDTQSLLVSVGIAEEQAKPVAAQVGDVHKAVTDRARRWYELF